jgi:hypothetical protein
MFVVLYFLFSDAVTRQILISETKSTIVLYSLLDYSIKPSHKTDYMMMYGSSAER